MNKPSLQGEWFPAEPFRAAWFDAEAEREVQRAWIWNAVMLLMLAIPVLAVVNNFPFGVFILGFGFIRPRASRRLMRRFAAPPELGEAIPVRVRYRNPQGHRLGDDYGWLSELDGWLIFEGNESRVAYGINHVHSKCQLDTLYIFEPHEASAEFVLVRDLPPSVRPFPDAIQYLYRHWKESPFVTGQPTLAPLYPHPRVKRLSRGRQFVPMAALLVVCLWALGVGNTALLFFFVIGLLVLLIGPKRWG